MCVGRSIILPLNPGLSGQINGRAKALRPHAESENEKEGKNTGWRDKLKSEEYEGRKTN